MPERQHPCEPPTSTDYPYWTRWECDDCGQEWILMHPPPLLTVDQGERVGSWLRWSEPEPDFPNTGIPERRPFRWPWRRR